MNEYRDWGPSDEQMSAKRRKREAEELERIAAFCHEQWSGWMRYLFSKSKNAEDGSCIIPQELCQRWWRQMSLDYKNLTDDEKESDRKEARRFLAALSPAKSKEE